MRVCAQVKCPVRNAHCTYPMWRPLCIASKRVLETRSPCVARSCRWRATRAATCTWCCPSGRARWTGWCLCLPRAARSPPARARKSSRWGQKARRCWTLYIDIELCLTQYIETFGHYLITNYLNCVRRVLTVYRGVRARASSWRGQRIGGSVRA